MSSDITKEYFEKLDIKVGDRLSEMLSFFITVIKVLDNGEILTIESNKDDIQVYKSAEDLKQRCSYKSESLIGHYWVSYIGNNIEKTERLIFEWKNSGNKNIINNGKIWIHIGKIQMLNHFLNL